MRVCFYSDVYAHRRHNVYLYLCVSGSVVCCRKVDEIVMIAEDVFINLFSTMGEQEEAKKVNDEPNNFYRIGKGDKDSSHTATIVPEVARRKQ